MPSGAYATQIRELRDYRGVIVFSQTDFTEQEQVEFTKTLGKFVPEKTQLYVQPEPHLAGEEVLA